MSCWVPPRCCRVPKLPTLLWAVTSAERFADGGVRALMGTGLVTHLTFGSECGDAAGLRQVAECLCSPAYEAALKERLNSGASFASCRQAAVEAVLGETAKLLESPNNTLGIEYCKALARHGSSIRPVTVKRSGSAHNGVLMEGEHPSASAIRELLFAGEREQALALMAPAMRETYLTEESAGRAPVFGEACERAVLARLRMMTTADFAALDEGREGLSNRLYEASRSATSVKEILETAKTKRYAYARLRRTVLWAYLGLVPQEQPEEIPYLRPLAANEKGRSLLAQMRKSTSVPVVTKAAHVRELGEEAQRLFELECRAADLYTLAYPDLSAAQGGRMWRESPVLV